MFCSHVGLREVVRSMDLCAERGGIGKGSLGCELVDRCQWTIKAELY